MLLFVLSINAQNGLSAQNSDKIAVIGNVISFEHLTEPDKIPTTGSTSGTFNISNAVRVKLNVKAVTYGEYSGETITFDFKSVFADNKFLKYGNVLCLLEKRENGVYVMPNPLDCCYDVYYDNNEGWVAAAFSGERFLPYTYQSNKRLLSLNSEQCIDSAYIKTRIERSYLDTQVKTIEEAYLFNDGKAIPKYGYPVSCLVDYILTTIKNKTNTVDNSVVATPRMVDLGLSVKWADCNLGATKPEEFGRYYAWGETEQKTTYTPENYKWCNLQSNKLTKYVIEEIVKPVEEIKDANGITSVAIVELYDPILPTKGTIDGKVTLEESDDAATTLLGNGWRTPTAAELQELYDNCEWTLIEQNGTRGYKATSKINGKSIFLPFAGHWSTFGYGGTDKNSSMEAIYMSSSLSVNHVDASVSIYLRERNNVFIKTASRDQGLTIRPVYDPE
jgi:hypothetical protein